MSDPAPPTPDTTAQDEPAPDYTPFPSAFQPRRFLTRVNGQEYLEVKWRLVWLRAVDPNATVETDCVLHSDAQAIFRATVTMTSGASATGWGSETPGDFGDFLEKAETKAIGRALGALGFGTQFTIDHADPGLHERQPRQQPPAPTQRPQTRPVAPQERGQAKRVETSGQRPSTPQRPAQPLSGDPREGARPTQKQIDYLWRCALDTGFTAKEMETLVIDMFGQPYEIDHLNRQAISAMIDRVRAGDVPPF